MHVNTNDLSAGRQESAVAAWFLLTEEFPSGKKKIILDSKYEGLLIRVNDIDYMYYTEVI